MPGDSSRFVFTTEMGEILRVVRRRAGLTQGEVMRRVGRRGRGAASLASRLERGRIRSPSPGLVCDYLRSCRARPDLMELMFGEHILRPLVAPDEPRQVIAEAVKYLPVPVRAAVLRYDTRTELARREDLVAEPALRRLPPDEQGRERVRRALKLAESLTLHRLANARVAEVLSPHVGKLSIGEMRWLGNYGRAVFAATIRNPGTSGPERRRKRRTIEAATARAHRAPGMSAYTSLVELEMCDYLDELKRLGQMPVLFERDRVECKRRKDAREAREAKPSRPTLSDDGVRQYLVASEVNRALAVKPHRGEYGRRLAEFSTRVARMVTAGDARRETLLRELAGTWPDERKLGVAIDVALAKWEEVRPGQKGPAENAPTRESAVIAEEDDSARERDLGAYIENALARFESRPDTVRGRLRY